jgi:hypothetical protein
MLADVQILIFCIPISYSSGRTFIVELLYLSSSIVFKLG